MRITEDWERELPHLGCLTSVERIYALYKAVEYVVDADVPGDLAECGVWRGGSVMVMAATLVAKGDLRRRIHLYDTFDGNPPPTEVDKDFSGRPAANLPAAEETLDSHNWAYAHRHRQEKSHADRVPSRKLRFCRGRSRRYHPENDACSPGAA
jgi:hypothetical protein